jgi:hypothetical protein
MRCSPPRRPPAVRGACGRIGRRRVRVTAHGGYAIHMGPLEADRKLGMTRRVPERCTVSSSLASRAHDRDNGDMRTTAARTADVARTWAPASPAAMRVATVVVAVLLGGSTVATVWRLGRRSVLTVGSAPLEGITAGVLAMSAISLVALTTWRRLAGSARPGGRPHTFQVVMAAVVPLLGGTLIGFAVSAVASPFAAVLLWQPRRLDVFLISLCVSAWIWPSFVGMHMRNAAPGRPDG